MNYVGAHQTALSMRHMAIHPGAGNWELGSNKRRSRLRLRKSATAGAHGSVARLPHASLRGTTVSLRGTTVSLRLTSYQSHTSSCHFLSKPYFIGSLLIKPILHHFLSNPYFVTSCQSRTSSLLIKAILHRVIRHVQNMPPLAGGAVRRHYIRALEEVRLLPR
jgi:hypothetical protein